MNKCVYWLNASVQPDKGRIGVLINLYVQQRPSQGGKKRSYLIWKVHGNTKTFFPVKTLKENTPCTALHTLSVLFSRLISETYVITLQGELNLLNHMNKRDRHKKQYSATHADTNKMEPKSEPPGLHSIQVIETISSGILTNNFNSNLPIGLSVNTVKVCPPTLCKRNGCSLGALTEAGFPPISLMLASSSFKVNDT